LVAFTTGNLVVDFPGNYGVRNFNGNCFSDASGTVEITVSASPNNPARIIASATEICRWSESTSKINLSASNRGTGMYYSWSKDGEPIAAQSLVDTLTVSEPGLYKLYSFDGATCGTVDSLLITEAQTTDYPEIQVISGTGCRGDSLVLGSTIPYTFYRWSDGSTASTIKVTGESFISLAAGNSMNCMANSTPFGFASLPRPDLCQVSVLDTTNINQIVWIKAPVGLGIDSVIILREERGLNNLKQIGKVDFDERPEFLDRSLELNTNTQNYRYRVQFVDSCGRRSVVSDSSRTMFLRVGKALGGGNNLFWTPYEGEPARIYYITRKQKGAGSLLPIDSVPGNIRTYSDRKPDANDSTEYQIWFERSAICSEDKAGVRTSRSNTRPAVPVPPPPRSNSRVFFRPCPGTTVTFGNFTFDSTGSYIVYVRDRNNMDSAVVINVTVARKDTIRQNQRLCNGRNIVFGSQLILTAGTYQRTLPNSLGCDSTIFLTVELDPKDSIGVEADICQGAIYSFEGQNYNTSGTYFRYLQNRLGCDSVRSLVLTVNANPDAPVITLLPGDTLSASGQGIFTWSVNGNVIPTITQGKIPIPPLAANYSVTLTDTNGCSATSLTFAFAGFAKLSQGKSQVWVYPNPSTGSIVLTGLPENEIPAIIRNAIGQTVWQGLVANERNLNLSHLTAGTYLLEVNQTQIRLVIVK
uniref:T9SS type A sorting domain-containing protein n=1 Tax=Umezakia ovalisporum TaxID=75695 RepID=UPI0039C70DE9